MPNQSTTYNPKCGDDKRGTFAPVPMMPNHGGKPMPDSGLVAPGARNMATNQSTKGGSGIMNPKQG